MNILKNYQIVREHLQTLPGGAQSYLASTNCERFVVKCRYNPQGPNVLANEMIAAEMMKAVSLPVPPWQFLRYEPDFACPFHRQKPRVTCGLPFGSVLLEPFLDGRVYAELPSHLNSQVSNVSDLIGAFVFDVWADAADRRQAVYVEKGRTGSFQAILIDNGHLFGGPRWAGSDQNKRSCVTSKFARDLTSQGDLLEYWTELIQNAVPIYLPVLLKQVPREWYQGCIGKLEKRLMERAMQLRRHVAEGIKAFRPLQLRPASNTGHQGILLYERSDHRSANHSCAVSFIIPRSIVADPLSATHILSPLTV